MKKLLVMLSVGLLLSSCGNQSITPLYNVMYDNEKSNYAYTFYEKPIGVVDNPSMLQVFNKKSFDKYGAEYKMSGNKVYYKLTADFIYLGYFISQVAFKEEINDKLVLRAK